MISVDLERHGPRARRSTRPRGSRACRPASFGPRPRGAAQRARAGRSATSPTLHPLDARRLDRHALVGHAVRPLRRHRRPPRAACAWSRPPGCWSRARCPRTSTGPSVREMVLGSEGRLGVITRGDRPGPARAARAHDPRLPVPDLGRVGLAAMRDIAASEAAPSVTRVVRRQRDRVLVRHQEGPVARRQAPVDGAQDVPAARARATTSSEMCLVVHRLRGHASATSRRSARRSGRIVARHGGLCIGVEPGRALRPEEVRHALHPRLPARPRRARRRLRDRGAVERARRRSTTTVDGGRPRRASTSSASAATSCATCRTPTTRARACTSRSRSCRRGRRDALDEYGVGQVGDPAGVRRQRRARCRTTTRSAPSTPSGSSRTSRRPASRCCARCSTGTDPGANLNPGKIV